MDIINLIWNVDNIWAPGNNGSESVNQPFFFLKISLHLTKLILKRGYHYIFTGFKCYLNVYYNILLNNIQNQ